MEGKYEILLGGEPVGQAAVEKQGLYYRIFCRCRLTGEVMYRVWVTCGEQTQNLGLLAPDGDGFSLTARLPVSRLGKGQAVFTARPRHGELAGKFVPLSPETPFAYLHRLENAFLERRNGQLGVIIREENQAD